MKIDYYKCSCGAISSLSISDFEWKQHGFPESSLCKKCLNFGARRIRSAKPAHVMQGKAGNYKNGYSSNEGYIKKT